MWYCELTNDFRCKLDIDDGKNKKRLILTNSDIDTMKTLWVNIGSLDELRNDYKYYKPYYNKLDSK